MTIRSDWKPGDPVGQFTVEGGFRPETPWPFGDSLTVADEAWDPAKHPRGQPENAGEFGPGGFTKKPTLAKTPKGASADKHKAALASLVADVAKRKKDVFTEAHLHSAVVHVGGDAWNRAKAVELQQQYLDAKPAMDVIYKTLVKEPAAKAPKPPKPVTFAGLSKADQASVEEHYWANSLPQFEAEEIKDWKENKAAGDAKRQIVNDFNNTVHGPGYSLLSQSKWVADAIEPAPDDEAFGRPARLPFSRDELLGALTLGLDAKDQLHLIWNDEKLDPHFDPKQAGLPGYPKPGPHAQLTGAQLADLKERITTAFIDQVTDKLDYGMMTPAYVYGAAAEAMKDAWTHMPDAEKYEYAKSSTDVLKDKVDPDYDYGDTDYSAAPGQEPKTFDPLQTGDQADYRATQGVARGLWLNRARQLFDQRKVVAKQSYELGDPRPVTDDDLRELDRTLWTDWKESSTSLGGRLIQEAASDELGGRFYADHAGINAQADKRQADKDYGYVGGYEGVKAAIRAKWETTQYLLDRAHIPVVNLYRTVNVPGAVGVGQQTAPLHGDPYKGRQYTPVVVTIKRNGAASATTDQIVANDWNGENRTVLRMAVPRTAVLSLPVYGINIAHEHEVVIAGTAWKSWDAWHGKAPSFDVLPVGAEPQAKPPEPEPVALQTTKAADPESEDAAYDEPKIAKQIIGPKVAAIVESSQSLQEALDKAKPILNQHGAEWNPIHYEAVGKYWDYLWQKKHP